MNVLIDTNVLLRLADEKHAMHLTASAAIEVYRRTKVLCIFPQNLYEFLVVATRPLKVNGLDYTQSEAMGVIASLERFYKLVPETPAVYTHWKAILNDFVVNGKLGHDAHLVAGMLANGITEILTFNDQDFIRFTGITTVNPKNVVVMSPPSDSSSSQSLG